MKVTAYIFAWVVGMLTGVSIGRAINASCMPETPYCDEPVIEWIESADGYDKSKVESFIITE